MSLQDGVYSVERTLENKHGCEPPREPARNPLKCFFVRSEMAGSLPLKTLGASDDEDTCQRGAKGESWLSLGIIAYLTRGLDTSELSGETGGTTMSVEGGSCKNAKARFTTVNQLEGGLTRVEVREVVVSYPGKDISDCTVGATLEAARGKECTSVVVMEARRNP
ncbi:MAG: hypothetical protein U0271_43345 [Polyangiaceae bacterium]